MNKKKILIIAILAIFCVGMIMGTASAAHTYKKNGYKFKVPGKTYKKIKYVKKHKYDSPDKMSKHKVFTKVKTNKYTKINGVKKRVYASIETHRTGYYPNMYYCVTYDFYVNGYGYIKFGGTL